MVTVCSPRADRDPVADVQTGRGEELRRRDGLARPAEPAAADQLVADPGRVAAVTDERDRRAEPRDGDVHVWPIATDLPGPGRAAIARRLPRARRRLSPPARSRDGLRWRALDPDRTRLGRGRVASDPAAAIHRGPRRRRARPRPRRAHRASSPPGPGGREPPTSPSRTGTRVAAGAPRRRSRPPSARVDGAGPAGDRRRPRSGGPARMAGPIGRQDRRRERASEHGRDDRGADR